MSIVTVNTLTLNVATATITVCTLTDSIETATVTVNTLTGNNTYCSFWQDDTHRRSCRSEYSIKR